MLQHVVPGALEAGHRLLVDGGQVRVVRPASAKTPWLPVESHSGSGGVVATALGSATAAAGIRHSVCASDSGKGAADAELGPRGSSASRSMTTGREGSGWLHASQVCDSGGFRRVQREQEIMPLRAEVCRG